MKKNKKLLIIFSGIGVCSLLFIFAFFQSHKNLTQSFPPNALPTPTPIDFIQQKQPRTLQPGSSTEQDAKTIYGNPIKTEVIQGNTVNSYAIPNTWRQHKVYIKDSKIQYVIEEEISNNTLYTDFTRNNNKQPDGILSDPQTAGGETKWYVFSTSGIAFFANTPSGYTFRVLTFPALPYQNFLETIAPVFSLSQTNIPGQDNNPQPQ